MLKVPKTDQNFSIFGIFDPFTCTKYSQNLRNEKKVSKVVRRDTEEKKTKKNFFITKLSDPHLFSKMKSNFNAVVS